MASRSSLRGGRVQPGAGVPSWPGGPEGACLFAVILPTACLWGDACTGMLSRWAARGSRGRAPLGAPSGRAFCTSSGSEAASRLLWQHCQDLPQPGGGTGAAAWPSACVTPRSPRDPAGELGLPSLCRPWDSPAQIVFSRLLPHCH